MKRLVILASSLVMILTTCAIVYEEFERRDCDDPLTVGDQVEFAGVSSDEFYDILSIVWSLGGPGELVSDAATRTATYIATGPGEVFVSYVAIGRDVEFPYMNSKQWDVFCTFTVIDPGAAPPIPEGTPYEVITTVINSNVEGVAPAGQQTESAWAFDFECNSGRCDAVISNGGPHGALQPFIATYRPATEDSVFDFILETPNSTTCDEDRWSGQITPTNWDGDGPVRFGYFIVNVLECDTGDVFIEWEGEGRRG